MKAALGKLWDGFCALNPLCRILLQLGFWLGYIGVMACWVLDICAGRFGDYWAMRLLAEEFSACVRSCVGLLGIGALVASQISPDIP
ncbi:MAG: hypothetical protein LBJ12_01385 [Oscillospiraceae bacterium]|jgi:hypothetical protein|nr:hypothetical protein [Oscillospiraceae bacterium]